MFHGSEEELRAAEMAGRVFDNLCTATLPEMHGIHQVHTGHIGGASLDAENETLHSSHNTSMQQQQMRRRAVHPHHSGVNSVVEIARRESVLRQLYNDKLRGSISAIFSAILSELPRDHIFLQLIQDQSTEQYCRVRVGEVVESFLFSVQAHQYHNLASELAKREVELLTLTAQLETVEQQLQVSPPLRSFKFTQTDDRVDSGINTEDSGKSNHRATDDEAVAAQDELIALLEEVTREHELAKCRECLSAPTSLLETVEAEEKYHDKFEYLSDVVAHLFRSVKGLVLYAEGSLDSLDALRHGLHTVCSGSNSNSDDGSKNNNELPTFCPPLSGTASEQLSPPVSQQRSLLFEEERAKLDALAAQLKYAQRHCSGLIQGLAKAHADFRRQNEAYQQQVQHLTMEKNTKEFGRALKANEAALAQLRNDLQISFAAERASAQGREQELRQRCTQESAKLQHTSESLSVVRQQLQTEIERRRVAEQRIGELESLIVQLKNDGEHSMADVQRAFETSRDLLSVQLRAAQLELVVCRADMVHARQEYIVLDAYLAKMELLVAHGYERAAVDQHYTLMLTKETMRHAQTQAEAAQKTLRELEETEQQCHIDLGRLLECMQEDELTAEVWRCGEEVDVKAHCPQVPCTATRTSSVTAFDVAVGTNKKQDSYSRTENNEKGDIDNDLEGGRETCSQQEQVEKALFHCHSVPKTLTGTVSALQKVYETVHRGQYHMQCVTKAARENVQQLQQENAKLRTRLERLASDYEQQRVNFRRLWDEQAEWAQQDTIKSLLTKQEALLSEVNLEREALRARWSTLSEEYQLLERRNSKLHERCTTKEAENARLVGLIRSNDIFIPLSLSMYGPKTTATAAVAQQSFAKVPEASHCARRGLETTVAVVESSPDVQQVDTPMQKRWASSSAAGLSGPARTSCGSVMDEELAMGATLPLGCPPRDRDARCVVFGGERATVTVGVNEAVLGKGGKVVEAKEAAQ